MSQKASETINKVVTTFYVTRWSYTPIADAICKCAGIFRDHPNNGCFDFQPVNKFERSRNKRPDATCGPFTESEAREEKTRQAIAYPDCAIYTWNYERIPNTPTQARRYIQSRPNSGNSSRT